MSYRRYRVSRLGRRAVLLVSLAVATVTAVGAGSQALGGPPEKAAPVVARGVTAGGVDLSGLTKSEAAAKLERAVSRPVTLRYRSESWRFAPQTLGARPAPRATARAALRAAEGTAVPLRLRLDGEGLQRWAKGFARTFDRRPKDAAVVLRGLRPRLSREAPGRRLDRVATQMLVAVALRSGDRSPLALAARRLRPKVTRSSVGPAIVVRRDSNRLVLYRGSARHGMRVVRKLGVATGQAAYPTPLGEFSIATMQRNPWWYPPASDWAVGASPTPPGPGNPLGTRWMGLSEPLVGIHGTPDAASIGYSASHGCIRMRIEDAEWLFERVRIGTPVFILAA